MLSEACGVTWTTKVFGGFDLCLNQAWCDLEIIVEKLRAGIIGTYMEYDCICNNGNTPQMTNLGQNNFKYFLQSIPTLHCIGECSMYVVEAAVN